MFQLPTYPGGKSGPGVFQTLINWIPPHNVFVSGFAGHCGVMKHKRPAPRNVAIDLDPTPLHSWAAAVESSGSNFEFFNCDCLEWLRVNFEIDRLNPGPNRWQDWFVFLDPPYPAETRSGGKIYRFDQLETDFHVRFLELSKRLPCPVMICSYPNSLYETALKGWTAKTFYSVARSGEKRTERAWMNYATPEKLHDCRFLGNDKREREKINRRRRNLAAKIKRLPPLERQSLIESIASTSQP